MKIALLNLPFDNNYGGNLQRFALMSVLQNMGHDVTHIYLRIALFVPFYRWPLEILRRGLKKYVLREKKRIFWEWYYNKVENEKANYVLPFYEKYIKHTCPVKNISEVKRKTMNLYDAYVVGSDQVWRENMTSQLGIENYFFKFLKKINVKKIAYGVSLGVDYNQFSANKLDELSKLYSKFTAVSYREKSAKAIFELHGWNNPSPKLVLDPTLLLDQTSYCKLISENSVDLLTSGKIYCYILDQNENVLRYIEKQKMKFSLDAVVNGIDEDVSVVSIPQWLNNIKEASLVITDSYHGSIFSIIFRKPFIFLGNKRRGNARIESLFSLLDLKKNENGIVCCSESVYQKVNYLKQVSLNFLEESLK